MSLPKIDLPLFELTIPSSGKKVKYRPFTVKEERILLIARETKDIDQIILSVKQVIKNCVYDINVDELPTFDLEYIIINIRARSVNNILEFSIEDDDTNETVPLKLDLDSIKLKVDERHNKKIFINDEYTMIMKYPTIDILKNLLDSDDKQNTFTMMINSIDILVSNDGDKIYKFSDFTEQEIIDFVESLNSKVIDDIRLFFETIPVLKVEIPYVNKNGNNKVFVLEGLNNFFL